MPVKRLAASVQRPQIGLFVEWVQPIRYLRPHSFAKPCSEDVELYFCASGTRGDIDGPSRTLRM